MKSVAITAALLLPIAGAAFAQERTDSPEGARSYIISPADGDVVTSPVTVVFGLSRMGVAPAGMERLDTGHHHLLIDTELPYMDEPIPSSDNYLHFGGGQTEVQLELEPGEHSLQLLLGDLNHIPHDPPVVSEAVTITVE
jgi:hypothetical protein